MSPFKLQNAGDAGGDAEFLDGMRRLGATSPANACADRNLPRLSRERFRALLDAGVLREATPGTFYVYESAKPARMAMPSPRAIQTRGLLLQLAFWLLIILIPVILLRVFST